jgi:hypothetical protein
MSVGADTALLRLRDHAKAWGGFEVARIGEFKSAPPNALCFAVWFQQLGASPVGSGLASTNALLRATARTYFPLTHRPEDEIELRTLAACDAYLGRINGDYTLGGACRNVDILGEAGDQPVWEGGHVNIDGKFFRIADLSMRIIFNDSWTQSEVTP